jgi:hypothetical protein
VVWLTREVQENLVETAVAGDVIIRSHLASYLHLGADQGLLMAASKGELRTVKLALITKGDL